MKKLFGQNSETRNSRIVIALLAILLIASAIANVFEYRRLQWLEGKFGSYSDSSFAKADRYAELRKHPVIAYIKRGVSEDEILNLLSSLQSSPDIEAIEYVSRYNALQNFRSTHPDGASYDEPNSIPFLASFRFLVPDQTKREDVASFIRSHDNKSLIDHIEMP